MCASPFSEAGDLGVQLLQRGEEDGEINVLRGRFPNNRFAFSYTWWSAYGYDHFIQEGKEEAQAMQLIDQVTLSVYVCVGMCVCGATQLCFVLVCDGEHE